MGRSLARLFWLLVVLISVSSLAFAVAFARKATADWTMVRTWFATEATIVAVGSPRRGRYGSYVAVQLRVADQGGVSTLRWAERELFLLGLKWSEPTFLPSVGSKVAVYVQPEAPHSVVPADAVDSIWISTVVVLIFLVGGGLMLWVAILTWKEPGRLWIRRGEVDE